LNNLNNLKNLKVYLSLNPDFFTISNSIRKIRVAFLKEKKEKELISKR